MANFPGEGWYQGSRESWNGMAQDSPGMHAWKKVYRFGWPIPKMVYYVAPVPEKFARCYVPWPWWKRMLPGGAYTSLWPNSRGNDWTGIKPDNFDESWRPPGPVAPGGWDKQE